MQLIQCDTNQKKSIQIFITLKRDTCGGGPSPWHSACWATQLRRNCAVLRVIEIYDYFVIPLIH